jgi:phosphate transport system substrate-binding protein
MSSGTNDNAATPPNTSTPPPTIQRSGGNRNMMWVAVAVVIVIIVVVGAAYAGGYLTPKANSPKSSASSCAPASQGLTGAGSTLVYPLMYFWSTTYHDSSINYEGVGSTSGINDITSHTVDYGASDAPLNPAQRAAAPGLMILPESAGAVVPIYNVAGVSKPINFTGQVLAEIFMGNITNWDNSALTSINPGITLPNATIQPVHRSDGSGTTFIFSSFLSADDSTWATLPGAGHSTALSFSAWNSELQSKGNAGVSSTVTATSDSIGYVDISYAKENSISYGAVKNPAGNYILANVSNSQSALLDSNLNLPAPTADWYNFSAVNAPGAGDYPIVSLTYTLIFQDPGKAFGSLMTETTAENLVDFLYWAIHAGQNYSVSLFYIPLPSSVVTYDDTELASIQYNGAALPECSTTS